MTVKKILVPDTLVEEKHEARRMPPTCPGCGAKFSFDNISQMCKKCGLPQEIVHMGPRIVARWKKQQGMNRPVGASKSKKRVNKHGRRGVKR